MLTASAISETPNDQTLFLYLADGTLAAGEALGI
jgi:hypothetical protein